MNTHVAMQFARMLKGAIANIAFVRTFLSMDSLMDAEVLFHRERLVAVLALVRLLAGVRSIVARKASRNRKLFTAKIALVRIIAFFGMCFQVGRQTNFLIEALGADGAMIHLRLRIYSKENNDII